MKSKSRRALRHRSTVRRPAVEGLESRCLLSLAGAVDPKFGTAGVAPLGFTNSLFPTGGDDVHDVAVQADGKTVAVGSAYSTLATSGHLDMIAVSRIDADGSPDASFGFGGAAFPVLDSTEATEGDLVAIQPDGKIVVAGLLDTRIVVARLNPDGSPDTTFGSGGTIVGVGGSSAGAGGLLAIATTPDGKIVLSALQTANGANGGETLVIRLDADGSPDATFGTGGFVNVLFDGISGENFVYSPDGTASLAVQPDGKILVTPDLGDGVDVVRLDVDGKPDASFGSVGQAILPLDVAGSTPDVGTTYALALQPDGKIVVSGFASIPNGMTADPSQTLVARLNPDGSADTSFGGTGQVLAGPLEPLVAINDNFASHAVAIQPDGKIVLSGTDAAAHLTLIRLEADGSADPSFGTDGEIVYPASGGSPLNTNALSVLPGGEIEAGLNDQAIRVLGQGTTVTNDFDDDGLSDPAVYIPSQGVFAYRPSGGGPDVVVPFGFAGAGQTLPAPGDYSGTGQAELAAYLPSLGEFAIRPANRGPDQIIPFGVPGVGQTIPAPGDYDGSGKTEIAAYIPSQGIFVYRPADGGADVAIPFMGAAPGQVIPAPGDYDGTGKDIPAAYIPSQGGFVLKHADGTEQTIPFGVAGPGQSIPVPGDYDGSGKTELAVYIPSQGILAYRPADGGPDVVIPFGAPGEGQTLPAPGDYDGSGKTELAAYIPSQGIFAYRPSGGRPDVVIPFGVPGPGQTIPFDTIDAAAASITPTVSAASVDVLPEVALKKARINQVSATVTT